MNFFNTQSLVHPFPAELLFVVNPNPGNPGSAELGSKSLH